MRYYTFTREASVREVMVLCHYDLTDKGNEWLMLFVCQNPAVFIGTGSPDTIKTVNLETCREDGIGIERGIGRGPIFSDSQCILGVFKSDSADSMQLVFDALKLFELDITVTGNDMYFNDRKIAGFDSIYLDKRVKSGAFVINVGSSTDNFPRYLIPSGDKTERHGSNYRYNRVGNLSGVPGITTDSVVTAIKTVYGEAEVIDYDEIKQNPEFMRELEIYGTKEWIYEGVRT